MARKTQLEAQETRNQILNSALHLFAEQGVSKTTLNNIAQHAGLTRGAIYWHFKNKADLFDAMMQRATLPLEEFNQANCNNLNTNPLESIRQCTNHAFGLLANDPTVQQAFEILMFKTELVDDMLPLRDRHLQNRQECIQTLQERFMQAKTMNLLHPNIQPKRAAIGLHALVDGLIANWVLDPSQFNLTEQAQHAVEIYLKGVAQE